MKIQIHKTSALNEQGGRFKNEDFVYPLLDGAQLDPHISVAIPNIEGLFMVCDGIGGENKGEFASQLAVSQLARYFDTFPPSGQVTYGYLSAALLRVEEAFSNHIQSHPESRGMGTTLALLYLDKYGATIAWIGNSRVYHYRKEQQLFKSRDHSLANDLIEQGKLAHQEVHNHPQNHVLLRSIKGTEEPTDLDMHFIPAAEIQPGDFFFLCTDGILEEVNDSELNTLFASPMGPEEIRQEIFSLCKGSSSDNFSFYLVQTGPLSKAGAGTAAAATPAFAVAEGELQVEEGTGAEEKYSIEEAAVFDEAEKTEGPGAEEGNILFDRLGDKEKASGGTVFDRIRAGNQSESASAPPREEKKEEPPKEAEQTEVKEEDSVARIYWPIALIVVGFILIMAAIWYYNSRGKNSYRSFTSRAVESMEAGEYDRAISLADSAFNATEDDALQKEANRIREEALNRKEAALRTLMAKADYHRDEGGYPGYWMALNYYKEALAQYADVADTERVKTLIADCEAALGKFPKGQAMDQLLSAAQLLCQKGHGEEAGSYLGEANTLADNQDLMRKVEKARLDCQSLVAAHEAAQPAIAERGLPETSPETRAVEEGSRSTAPAASSAEPDETGDLADLQPASGQPVAATTPASSSRGEIAPRSTSPVPAPAQTTASGATRGSIVPEGPAGGFMATRDGSPPPTDAQLRLRDKGKALYYQSRGTQSKYEEKKAAEYLKKSGPALDGEGYYILARLYNDGWGLERDEKKVLNYAMKSSGLGYPDGSYFYATLLLARQNRIDSNNAKEALNFAASMGHEPSLSKLQEMQFMLGSQ